MFSSILNSLARVALLADVSNDSLICNVSLLIEISLKSSLEATYIQSCGLSDVDDLTWITVPSGRLFNVNSSPTLPTLKIGL